MIEFLNIYSLLGGVGMILIIINYLLLSNKKLKTSYVLYHLLNLFGAAGIAISTFVTQSWPAMVLSLIFSGISLFYIIKILGTKTEYKEFR
jgi:hypothetical protein